MRARAAALALALATASAASAGAVYRCTDARGAVTYQDAPCPRSQPGEALDIPGDFPPPNQAEHARILEREAMLERRLEARREREARDEAMRLAATPPPAVPAPAPEAEPAYPLYIPLVPAHVRRVHGHRHHGVPPRMLPRP
jgi:hypothetical protein